MNGALLCVLGGLARERDLSDFGLRIHNEQPRRKQRGIEKLYNSFPKSCHPRMFLSGVQSEVRLDSR